MKILPAVVVTGALSLALTLALPSPAAADTFYDEAVQGDLSGDGENPTPLGTWFAGVHTISGTMGGTPGGSFDADIFTFTIPSGLRLNSILVTSITPGENSFFAIAAGDTISTTDPNAHLSNILIGEPGEYFDDLANPVYGGPGITGPLGGGTYTVWFQETNLVRDYTLVFGIPLPEPMSAGAALIALCALASTRPRRQ